MTEESVLVEVLDEEEDIDVDAVLASIEELRSPPSAPAPADPSAAADSDSTGGGSPAEEPGDGGISWGDEAADLDAQPAELSKPEERDRLIAQALAHAEAQDARYRQPMPGAGQAGRWKSLFAMVVFLISGYVAVAPPSWTLGDQAPRVTEGDQVRGVRFTLLLQAEEIETFRALNQRLPESLNELSVQLPGIRFVRSGPRAYQLFGFSSGGERIVYDPASPDVEFEAVRGELESIWGES